MGIVTMTSFFSMSIRKQLYLMALILALPAVILVIYSGLEKRNEDIEESRENIYQLAENIASEQKNLVAGSQQLMSVLSQLPEVRNHKTAKAQSVLANVLKMNPQYLNIIVADRSGSV